MERIDITSLSNEGLGIGILESGKKCFVEGALPGESVTVSISKEASKYSFAKAEEYHSISPDRVLPALSDPVPGAAMAHLSYEGQLRYKSGKVRDCLIRLGRIEEEKADGILQAIVPSEKTTGYRNHMQYRIDGNLIGQTGADGTTVIPFEKEYLEYPVFGKVIEAVKDFLDRSPTRLLTGLVLRGSERTKEITAEFITGDTRSHELVVREVNELISSTGLIDRMREAIGDYKLAGVMFRISPDKVSRRTRSGKRFIIDGNSSYEEIFCGRKFTVEAGSFFQVNIPQAEAICGKIKGFLNDCQVICDLYCGAGTLGLSVLHEGGELLGIESSREAVASAVRNAESAFPGAKDRITFVCKDCGKTDLKSFIDSGKIPSPDAVIVDPPRKGLDDQVIMQLIRLNVKKLVYVSCDPATLARDLKELSGTYSIESVTPVDMFPMTQHIENLVILTRKKTEHQMNLDPAPYEMIKSGSKTIELRLFDEKRRRINPGDTIVFTNNETGEKLFTRVLKLHCFKDFEELYKALPLMQCGYSEDDIDKASPSDMEQYYSIEEQKKYGVVGIELIPI